MRGAHGIGVVFSLWAGIVSAQASDPRLTRLAGALVSGTATESDVIELLDQPETRRTDGAVRILEFSDGQQSILVVYGADRFGLFRGLDPFTPEAFKAAADTLSTPHDFLRAVGTLERCVRQCQNDVNKLVARLQQMNFSPGGNIEASVIQLQLARRAMALDSPVSKLRLQAQLRQITERLQRQVLALLTVLNDRAVTSRAVAALPKAKQLTTAGNFKDGWDIVAPFMSHPSITSALAELSELALNWFQPRLREAGTLEGAADLLRVVTDIPKGLLLRSHEDALLVQIGDLLKRHMLSTLPSGLDASTPEGVRLLQLRSDDLFGSRNHEAMALVLGAAKLSVNWSLTEDVSCPIAKDRLVGFINQHLPREVTLGEKAVISVGVSLSCEISDTASSQQSLPSSYTAGIQQLANPAYARAQAELAAAQASLAKLTEDLKTNPPVGIAAGWLAGRDEFNAENRVKAAQNALLQTPPYIENRVSAPYTAFRRTFAREGKVRFRITLRDASTSFDDSRQVMLAVTNTDDEITGVMSADERRLRNREPSLPTAEALYPQALTKNSKDLSRALRELLQSALLRRAQSSRDAVFRLGSMVIAADIDPASEDFKPFNATLDRLRVVPVSGMLEVTPPVVTTKTPVSSVKNATARTSIVSVTLRSLFTIRHAGGQGSGFAVSDDGLVLTNAHVVDGASRVVARNMDGDEFLVSIVQTDVARDIALLRLAGWKGNGLKLALDPAGVNVGDEILAIGNPLGLEGTVTRGIVSAKRRIEGIALIQVDAAISPGSSGGPLVNEAGEVIGITSWKIAGERSAAESLGFAVASSEISKAFPSRFR